MFALHAEGGLFLWSVWHAWRDCKTGEAPNGWGAADTRRRAVREARRLLASAVRVDDAFARRWVNLPPKQLWHAVPDDRGGLRACNHAVTSLDGEWLWYRACCTGGEMLERITATVRQREAAAACITELLPGLLQRTIVLFLATRPPRPTAVPEEKPERLRRSQA